MRWATVMFLILGIGCKSSNVAKAEIKRPASVPSSAVWAGGADGGSFIDCKEAGTHLDCVVYDEGSGALEAKGRYLERMVKWDPATSSASYLPYQRSTPRQYSGWDGDIIHLEEGVALIPDGWIEHPDVHKKSFYKEGLLVREASTDGEKL